eukprot:Nk52_evm37s164 gene=Nk52_evmTU37s164
MIHYVLLVNKQGQTRVCKYYSSHVETEARKGLEAEVIRKILLRKESHCYYTEHEGLRLIYRKYASLYVVLGVDQDENELSCLDFIHLLVEVLDKQFDGVCELDFMYKIDKVHFVLDEMIINGYIAETNKRIVSDVVSVIDKFK